MVRTHKPLLALATLVALAACAAQADSTTPPAVPSGAPVATETIQVFAAASLTDAFGEIAEDFEAANPGVHVNLAFAGSSDLAAQISEGAPADVFASANERQMQAVGDAVPAPQVFASNTLTIVVPLGNPAGIGSIGDLTQDTVKLVICAPEVPCGAATKAIAEAQGVTFNPVSEESSATDVLGKVASGEADAGIVYVTDVARAKGVAGVPLAGAEGAVNVYPIGELASSAHPEAAHAFVAWVLSDAGQAVLASYGFGAP